MKRGDIIWADLPAPWGHRPVVIISREHSVQVRGSVCVAQLTSTQRGLDAEVKLSKEDGVSRPCVINCDNLLTIRKSLLGAFITRLTEEKKQELNNALRFALGLD